MRPSRLLSHRCEWAAQVTRHVSGGRLVIVLLFPISLVLLKQVVWLVAWALHIPCVGSSWFAQSHPKVCLGGVRGPSVGHGNYALARPYWLLGEYEERKNKASCVCLFFLPFSRSSLLLQTMCCFSTRVYLHQLKPAGECRTHAEAGASVVSLSLFLSLSLSVSPIPKKVDKNGMKKRGEMKTTTTTIPSSSFQTLPFFFLLFASLYILLYGNLSLLDDLLRRGVHLLFFLLFAWLANFSLSLSLFIWCLSYTSHLVLLYRAFRESYLLLFLSSTLYGGHKILPAKKKRHIISADIDPFDIVGRDPTVCGFHPPRGATVGFVPFYSKCAILESHLNGDSRSFGSFSRAQRFLVDRVNIDNPERRPALVLICSEQIMS